MLYNWVSVAHIAVLGYWLGSELVINSTFRYVCYRSELPYPERKRLMGHVMHVDQHVRYALIFQLTLGTILGAYLGYFPGGSALMWAAAAIGTIWFAYVELVHRLANHRFGPALAKFDRATRYVLIMVVAAIAVGLVGGSWPMPSWLRWKLAAFAGVIMSGVGIRLALLPVFRTWAQMDREGPTDQTNAALRSGYWKATFVLISLWVFIAIVVILSVEKLS